MPVACRTCLHFYWLSIYFQTKYALLDEQDISLVEQYAFEVCTTLASKKPTVEVKFEQIICIFIQADTRHGAKLKKVSNCQILSKTVANLILSLVMSANLRQCLHNLVFFFLENTMSVLSIHSNVMVSTFDNRSQVITFTLIYQFCLVWPCTRLAVVN